MKAFVLGVAVVVLGVACAPAVSRCTYGPVEILGEVELDCAKVTAAGDALRALYTEPLRQALPLDPDASYSFETPWPKDVGAAFDFDKAFQGYTVVVQQAFAGIACSGKEVSGCTVGAVTYLTVDSGATAWAHESRHFLECKAGDCDNLTHEGWTTNGFYNFGYAFVEAGPQDELTAVP